ncbi:MAG: isoprenyl transferase [Bacteroidetes bacterium]|nr:isoprenyl transferase [Bacteroidota bacterium]
MDLKDKIDKDKLPKHIAVIMDGNGRWAKQRGRLRTFGHRQGVRSVRETAEAAAEIGIKYLTLYAFSTENWKRPKSEVNALMNLLVKTIHKETKTLHDNKISLKAIGNLDSLPEVTRRELFEAIKDTRHHQRMTMILALSYSSRWEIVNSALTLAKKIEAGEITSADINEQFFESCLTTHAIPDPELLIRTSGEYRISNFLLWQIAYSELYFTPKLWPDFRKEDLYEAILDYQKRERRFGKTSEQIIKV